MDEPLSNLDAKLRVSTRTQIAALQQRLGVTTVYVTHDQIEAMTMADKIVVMNSGVVEQSGPPLELYDRPANLFVAGFIGSPAMNFLPGTLRRSGTVAEVELDDGTRLPAPPSSGTDGQAVVYGARPENLVLAADGGLPVKVVVIEPTGADTLVVIFLGGEEFTVRLEPDVALAPGQKARFLVDLAKLVCFDPATEMLVS